MSYERDTGEWRRHTLSADSETVEMQPTPRPAGASEFSRLADFLHAVAGSDLEWREWARGRLGADPGSHAEVARDLEELLSDPRASEAWVRLWAGVYGGLPNGLVEPGMPILRSLAELRAILREDGL